MVSVYSWRYQRLLHRLRAARLQTGLTQAQVGRTLGRPQSFVSKCESGERRLDAVELADLASLYGKPVSFFLDEAAGVGGAEVAAEPTGWHGSPRRSGPKRRIRGRRP